MEDTKDYSWKDSKTLTNDKLGRIVPIPLSTSNATIKDMSPPSDEGKEEEKVMDVAKRRFASVLSRKLHDE